MLGDGELYAYPCTTSIKFICKIPGMYRHPFGDFESIFYLNCPIRLKIDILRIVSSEPKKFDRPKSFILQKKMVQKVPFKMKKDTQRSCF